MQTGINATGSHSNRPQLLMSTAGILLSLLWFYLFSWAAFMLISALQPNAGGWKFGEWVVTGAILVPVLFIPVYLVRCFRRNGRPGLRLWLTWVARVFYVSVILALVDSWAAGTERGAPVFSRAIWEMRDRGTTAYIGLGYCLTYYWRIGGVQGPEVWFWFTPFTVSCTTKHTGLRWLWQAQP